jgi:hypothetical protein
VRSYQYLQIKKASYRSNWLLFDTLENRLKSLPYYLGCVATPSAGLPPATSAGAGAGAGAVALSAGAGAAAFSTGVVGAGAGSFFEQAARPKSAVATAIVVNIFMN